MQVCTIKAVRCCEVAINQSAYKSAPNHGPFKDTNSLALPAKDKSQFQDIIKSVDSFRRDYFRNVLDANRDHIDTIEGIQITRPEDKNMDDLILDLTEKFGKSQRKHFQDLASGRYVAMSPPHVTVISLLYRHESHALKVSS
jgi:hypothetical protein